MNNGTSEIWVNVYSLKKNGEASWAKIQEIEHTLEKTSSLCWQNMVN